MSGIIGIYNLDGRPVEEAVLTGMSATLAHRGPDGQGLWVQGPMGLACQLLRVTPEAATETQPLVHASGAVLVFDGRLDNREELLASLKASPGISPDSPDPALVLAAYEAFGERLPERLNGDFALGLFEPSRRQLLLARDAIGIRPLYYCRTGDTFLFASEIKAILAHPDVSPQPNDELLADFQLVHVYDPEVTLFTGIFSLPPAHTLVLTTNGLTKHRYWDFDPSAHIRLGSFPDYAEAFRKVFEQAVRRRLRSRYPVAVSVSGGVDSSAIFCLGRTLVQQDQAPAPDILGFSKTSKRGLRSDEQDFLGVIEGAYGISIHRIPSGPAEFVDGSREAVWYLEVPYLAEEWTSFQRLLRAIHGSGARVLLTGHWGDEVLCQLGYLVDLVRRLRWKTLRAHLKEIPRWITDVHPDWLRRAFLNDLIKYHAPIPVFLLLRWIHYRYRHIRPWYSERLRRQVLKRQWRRLPIGGQFPTIYTRGLYEEMRSGFRILCMEWNNKVSAMHGLEIAFPFLDRDLLCFLMAIPGEISTYQGRLKALLREAMQGILPEPIAQRRWKADATQLVNEGVAQEFAKLTRRLESGGNALRGGYLDRTRLTKDLETLRNRLASDGSAELAWSVSDLLGLEEWLGVFFEGGKRRLEEVKP